MTTEPPVSITLSIFLSSMELTCASSNVKNDILFNLKLTLSSFYAKVFQIIVKLHIDRQWNLFHLVWFYGFRLPEILSKFFEATPTFYWTFGSPSSRIQRAQSHLIIKTFVSTKFTVRFEKNATVFLCTIFD